MDITPERSWRIIWLATFLAALLVAGTGLAAAAVRYDDRHRDVFLDGMEIGGVDLGGLTLAEARELVAETFETPLGRRVMVKAGDATLETTPRVLGASTNAEEQLAAAQRFLESIPMHRRLWHRMSNTPLDHRLEVRTTVIRHRLEGFTAQAAQVANKPAQDPAVDLIDGELVVHQSQQGFILDPDASEKALLDVIHGRRMAITLPGQALDPPGEIDVGNVIVVRLGEGRLYHYLDSQLVKSYPIVHGGNLYPTPTGVFSISAKRVNPTWRNPAKYPGGWGQHLPAVIGPGYGNPLGTRALNLGNTLIRIHGTFKPLSANESRGCIRMRIPDSEELFERVTLGTQVIVVP